MPCALTEGGHALGREPGQKIDAPLGSGGMRSLLEWEGGRLLASPCDRSSYPPAPKRLQGWNSELARRPTAIGPAARESQEESSNGSSGQGSQRAGGHRYSVPHSSSVCKGVEQS